MPVERQAFTPGPTCMPMPVSMLSVAALRYDAGDNVKFNLPMAWSAGVLAWSLVDFEAGYKAAGEYKTALDSIKWVTDYFIKCVGDGKSDIVVQVGHWASAGALLAAPGAAVLEANCAGCYYCSDCRRHAGSILIVS